MQEYTESDEELRAMRDSFGRRNEEALVKVREAGEKREVLGKELRRVRDELGTRTAEMGGLEEARRAHERALGRREEVLREVAMRHGFKGLEVSMEDDKIEEMKNLLYQTLKEEKGKLDKLKVSIILPPPHISLPPTPAPFAISSLASVCIVSNPLLQRESVIQENGLTDQLHALTLQQQTHTATRQTSTRALRQLESKLQDLNANLDTLSTTESDVAQLKAAFAQTTSALETAQHEFDAANYDAQVAALEGQIAAVETELRGIQTELTTSSARSDLRAKLDVLRGDITKKESARTALVNAHAEKFHVVTGQHLDPSTNDSVLSHLIRRKQDDVDEATNRSQLATADRTAIEAKILAAKDTLKEKRHEKNEATKKLMDVSDEGVEGFPGLLADLEENVMGMRGGLENLRYAGGFFEKAIKEATERNVCSLCLREFHEHDIDDFTHKVLYLFPQCFPLPRWCLAQCILMVDK